jgi:hypothetical protein
MKFYFIQMIFILMLVVVEDIVMWISIVINMTTV